jgi:DNA-binding SARP family transcriptional activator
MMITMEMPKLPEPYKSLYARGDFDTCRESLEKDGLRWFFNLQFLPILSVIPLIRQLPDNETASPRLTLLQYAGNPECEVHALTPLLDRFKQCDDVEGTAACIMLALGAIWENSYDFKEFAPWVEQAEVLLASLHLPSLARGALLLQCCWTECVWQGDLEKVNRALPEVLRLGEQAKSPSLVLMHSALAVYVHGWQGDLATGELVLHDAEPYLALDGTSPLAIVQYHNSRALLSTLQGDLEAAGTIFARVLEDNRLDQLPSSVWLLVYANYLHLLVAAEDKSGVEGLAKRLAERIVPEQKRYYHSYLHFNLGVAELAMGRPYKALLHADEAQKHAKLCGSANAVRMLSLVKGQALMDLEKNDEALEFFNAWLPKWEKAKFYLIAAQAFIEVATIHARKNDAGNAKYYLNRALSLTPLKEKVPVLYRQARYLDKVRQAVRESQLDELRRTTPVYIRCLGKFGITMDGRTINVSGWEGKQTGRVLKAIIALGGVDIPIERVADLLWPDSDGDRALGAFKVSLSRLRKSLQKIHPDKPWIMVKNGKLSLNTSVCTVDCAVFSTRAAAILGGSAGDEENIREALSLYSGNFLSDEPHEPWQTQKGDKLLRRYVEMVLLLAELLRMQNRRDEESACLHKALEFGGVNEKFYALLMESYLAQGRHSKVLETYYQAKVYLQETYGIDPGNDLSALASRARK